MDVTTGESKIEAVAETEQFCEEVMIMKTEVKEEPFDYETTVATELWDEVKTEVDPLSCVKDDGEQFFPVDLKKCNKEPNETTFASNFCRNWKEQLAKKLKTGPGVGVCSRCKMEFFDQKSFGEHLASCKNKISRSTSTKKVDNCPQKNLSGHSKEKKFSCPNCARSFYQKFNLTCHINMIHLDERRYKCDSCSYATVFKHSLENHVLAMHSNVEKRYKCMSCDYSSMFKSGLVLHMRSHSGQKPFKCTHRICKCSGKPCKCDHCNFASAHKQALKGHVFLKHTQSSKKYKYKKGLEKHIVVKHNQEPKAHRCPYENQSEEKTRECSLRRHVLARHSNGEKSYKCGKCKYSAYRKESLVNHFKKYHVPGDLPDTSN